MVDGASSLITAPQVEQNLNTLGKCCAFFVCGCRWADQLSRWLHVGPLDDWPRCANAEVTRQETKWYMLNIFSRTFVGESNQSEGEESRLSLMREITGSEWLKSHGTNVGGEGETRRSKRDGLNFSAHFQHPTWLPKCTPPDFSPLPSYSLASS
jgi:hypothetical protein